MIRAVLDTNVLVSSILSPTGTPGRIVRAWRTGQFDLYQSRALFAEAADVLQRPSLRETSPDTPALIEALLTSLAEVAVWVPEPLEVVPVVAEDPDDDVVLATACAAQADVIVSGDRHLHELRMHAGIPITSPRDFVDLLGGAKP